MQSRETEAQEYVYAVFCQEEGTSLPAYGIVCRDAAGAVVETIADISPDRSFVDGLARLLNEERAQACHFWDIVEDALP